MIKMVPARWLFPAFLLLAALILPGHPANGQESTQEPYISLRVLNQPLSEVLDKISQDTGYTFKLKEEWKGYPVTAAIQNLPLSQGLKRILTPLNHAIIYESENKIHILVYGKADTREKDSRLTQAHPSSDPNYPIESAPSPEEILEDTENVPFTEESAQEAETLEEMMEVIPSDQEAGIPAGNPEESRDQRGARTNVPSESAQSQN
jgi:hypothetical protein